MRIIFRTDSSLQIGTGHLQRCITLANALRQQGAVVSFICRDLPGNGIFLLKKHHFSVQILSSSKLLNDHSPQCKHQAWLGVSQQIDADQTLQALANQTIDWMIVDHYALDAFWESQLRIKSRSILVIDDLADRTHDCDVLLDQNYYLDQAIRYDLLIPKSCHLLLGPHYALLRDEFSLLRKNTPRLIQKINKISVFFGGCDLNNTTEKTIKALQLINRNDIKIDVLIGALNPNMEALKKAASTAKNIFLHTYMDSIAEWLNASDFAIGAGGVTLLERSCLGLPSLILSCATNQEQTAKASAIAGFAYYLGPDITINKEQLAHSIQECITNHDLLKRMSQKGMELVDGKGTSRVVNRLLQ